MFTNTEEELTRLKFHPEEWIEVCRMWRGRILDGLYAHYCYSWDELPVDETTEEYLYCKCNKEEIKFFNIEYGKEDTLAKKD